ncbi:unnamed protein product [Spirodela intermedia]|uniref:Uncharacterized protein n=1 Tax=Spirodela intermedia TaxID=51605 RepID=A0ABN7EE81_SPIIN|nr:unnamed protein product [Spirodela intermedia]
MASSHSVTGGVYKAGNEFTAHVCRPGHKGHDDLTSSSPSSGLSPAVCGILNALATALHGSIRTAPSIHHALRPIIPDNACILCLTAAAGTELADAYSSDTVIASSPRKEVHDPWAFYLHAALLRQAFAHCGKFPLLPPVGVWAVSQSQCG